MARRARAITIAAEADDIARDNQAVAEQLTSDAAIREFLSWLRRMPSISELRVTRDEEGSAAVWAIQDVEDLGEAHDAYLRLCDLLARDDTRHFGLYIGPRSAGTDTRLATAHKL